MIKESSLRTILATKDAPATVVYSIDKELDDELVYPRSKNEKVRHSSLGSGTRNADTITDGGFPPVEDSLDFALQVAKFLYGVQGSCVTTGTSTGETGTVTSGQGTDTLVLSGGGAFTINEFAGMMLSITSGENLGKKYHIKSNSATAVTIDKNSPGDIDGDGYRIDGKPFTHTISEGFKPPSFALHQELENYDNTNPIRKDLLGVIIDSWTGTIEVDSDMAEQSVGIIGAKSITGSNIAQPSQLDNTRILNFKGVITNTLTYNSLNTIVNADNDSIQIEINNNASIIRVQGDCYPDHEIFAERDYTLTLTLYPEDSVLIELQNINIEDFLTDLEYICLLSTVGGSHITPITDTVASGGGTTVLTLTTGGLTVDAHIDSYLVVTAGDNIGATFRITDNDATTVTLDTVTPTNINGDSVEIKWPSDIKFTFDKLYVEDAPISYPSKDDAQYSGDYVFKTTGAGKLAVVSHDDLGIAHYEGSS